MQESDLHDQNRLQVERIAPRMRFELRPASVEDMQRVSQMTADAMSKPDKDDPGGRWFELIYPDYTTPEGTKGMTVRLIIYATKFPNVTHSWKVVDLNASDPTRAIACGLYTEEPEPPKPPPEMPSHYWDKYPGLKDYVGVHARAQLEYVR